tara:strand:+ start:18278 stop:18535 length:258 start_codon:yes stop_codon:yes gene_type:complete
MVMTLYWSTGKEAMSMNKDIFTRVLYLLFSIMAISSFVTIAKVNRKQKSPLTQLLFPSFFNFSTSIDSLGAGCFSDQCFDWRLSV